MPSPGEVSPYRRPMPADFPEKARMPACHLKKLYRCSDRVIIRWREELGINHVPRGRLMPWPDNLAELCQKYSLREMAKELGWPADTLRHRLKKEHPALHVIACKTGERKRVEAGRAAAEASRKPKPPSSPLKPKTCGWKLPMRPDVQTAPKCRADDAMRYMQRFGPCYPMRVINKVLDGYSFRGIRMTGPQIIAEAQKRGWNPDAWREIAA